MAQQTGRSISLAKFIRIGANALAKGSRGAGLPIDFVSPVTDHENRRTIAA